MKRAVNACVIALAILLMLALPTCSNSPDFPDYEPTPTANPI